MRPRRARWCVAWWVLASGSVARADVIPEPPDVCSTERTCPGGKECAQCPLSRANCQKNLAPLGFTRQCTTARPGLIQEVWCRPASGATGAEITLEPIDAGPELTEPEQTVGIVVCPAAEKSASSGGGCSAAGSSSAGWSLSGLLGLALLWARRPPRWRRSVP